MKKHRKFDKNHSIDQLIERALTSASRDEAEDALWSLRCRATREVFRKAEALCNSSLREKRELGVCILSQLGVPTRRFRNESERILIDLLATESDEGVIESICYGLGHLQSLKGVPILTSLRRHANQNIRLAVVCGLEFQSCEAAAEALIDLSRDPATEVRNQATFALGSMIDLNTKEIRDALYARLTDDDPEIRGEAMLGLAIRKDIRCFDAISSEIGSNSVGILSVEAACELGDARLYPELVALKGWWTLDESLLKKAILSCDPVRNHEKMPKLNHKKFPLDRGD
ncbi:MAG: HEAT repeat domain-containing protein [Candidatus Melainabacteria bacterium]|jgi:HEAT repeat protein|nr:HEAT repeat domain-containing protein [Candidatus Melainabacteria bacterium]